MGGLKLVQVDINPLLLMSKGNWMLESGKFTLKSLMMIEWVTVGSGVFGGDEKGTIDADFGPGRHVKFTWFNPDNSNSFNRCTINWTGKLVGWCSILTPAGVTSGPFANARFTVSTSCDIFRCQENGSVDQDVRFDDLFIHQGPIFIHHDPIDIHPPKFHPPEFDFPIPDL